MDVEDDGHAPFSGPLVYRERIRSLDQFTGSYHDDDDDDNSNICYLLLLLLLPVGRPAPVEPRRGPEMMLADFIDPPLS